MSILAIDPGNTYSAYAVINPHTRGRLWIGKVSNEELRHDLRHNILGEVQSVAIEMVESFGMPVGREVFDTCVWIGRFQEVLTQRGAQVELVGRTRVKLHHCRSRNASDSNISRALVDRFAPGEPNMGKGTAAAPGWFHGFAGDIWQAYALAVMWADLKDPAYLP